MKRKLFHISLVVLGLIIAGVVAVSMIWPVLNEVETGKTAEYADVVPQYYSTDPQRVFDEVRGGVTALNRWELIKDDRPTWTVQAERSTRTMGFVDDIEIRVEPVTEFATRVNVKSKSRVGKGDFGQNARNIQEFFVELDRRLGAVKFDPQAEQK